MANKKQQVIKRSTGEWMYCSFQAHPEELARWRALAAAEDRSLSAWIRRQLRKGDSNETPTEDVPVETVSPDRA
jgi:hypothetical protein